MMQIMGVINLAHEHKDLQDLTIFRCNASVPFGGRYRFVDFILSSMVNSNIHNIAILANKKYTSLMDHVKNGKAWDLNRKRDGLFLLPPADYDNFPGMLGDIKNFYWHLDYFYRSTQDYVVVSGSHVLLNIDYQKVVRYHESKDADITIIYADKQQFQSDVCEQYCKSLNINEDRIVKGMDDSLAACYDNYSLDMYVMKRTFLIELIESSMIKGHTNLTKHAIMKNIGLYTVAAYKHEGYVAPIFSIKDYYTQSLKLLDSNNREQLFHHPGTIYTKVKDEPPSKYLKEANVTNSLIANGCNIEGTIESSILFRGVKVHKGAIVKNCIIMQRCEISENAVLENVILDKEVFVTKNGQLIGNKDNPTVVARRMVI